MSPAWRLFVMFWIAWLVVEPLARAVVVRWNRNHPDA